MSARIETLRTRPRDPEIAWLVAAVGLLALLAVLTLVGRIAPDAAAPVRPPAVATTIDSVPGAAIKAIANDPYLRVRPPVDRSVIGEATTTSAVSGLGFGRTSTWAGPARSAGSRDRYRTGAGRAGTPGRLSNEASSPGRRQATAPWHFLYFLPDPHGQGALRGTLPLLA